MAAALDGTTESEAEALNDAEAEGIVLGDPVPAGRLKENDSLAPVGTGLRQKSFNHHVYFPLSVALQRVEMQEFTSGPSEGAQRARGSETLNWLKQPFQHSGMV